MAALFAGATAIGLRGQAPPWGDGVAITGLSLRVLLASVGLACGVAATVLAAAYLKRAEQLVRLKLRMIPILETEGPCRLVQEAPNRWGLELSLDPAQSSHPARELIQEATVGRQYPWEPGPAHCRLFFRLDEADVAELSRIFHPDEELRLRWADLPLHAGGPTLLSVRTSAREIQVHPAGRRRADRRIIRSSEPPDSTDGFRRAA
ncbi:MAG: hypothetical protein R3E12_01150 [Candidatus Eisenbacteria bacterium]